MARSRKAKTSLKVDFTGVEASGNVKAGRQLAEVSEVELKTSESSGNDYLNWKLKAKGGAIYHTTSLQPQSLWNLRNMLEAMGMEVPEAALELDLTEFPGMELGVEVEHETYQGKKKPIVVDLFPAEELDGEEAESPEEEEEGEELTYEDLASMDKSELIELAGEEGIKLTVKAKKTADTLIEFLADKLGLEPEAEEEAEESADITYDEVMEMDKEELLELAEENEIKVLAKQKRKLETLREHIASELGLEGEEEAEEEEEKPQTRSRRKRGSKSLEEGSTVTFQDDGEDIEGEVLSINTKEGFAVIDVDGEEWEVELEDIKVK